jgi:hypothetical protein
LTVELLESKLTSLQFRGGNLVKDDLSDLIVKLCQKYNQEYQLKVKQNKNGDGTKRSIHSEGFLLYGKYQVEEYPETFEKIRDLRDNYKIKDFNNKTVALLEDNLFPQNGIGFKISVEEKVYCDKFFRKNVECGEKEYDLYEFKYWNDILKLNISDKGNDWNSYFVYSYDVKKYFNNRRFKNVEMQQFFIELQNLIYSEIK